MIGKALLQIGPGLSMNFPAEKDIEKDDRDQQDIGSCLSEKAQDQIEYGMSEELEAVFDIPGAAGRRSCAGGFRIIHPIFSSV
jgi:hypothetical protein